MCWTIITINDSLLTLFSSMSLMVGKTDDTWLRTCASCQCGRYVLDSMSKHEHVHPFNADPIKCFWNPREPNISLSLSHTHSRARTTHAHTLEQTRLHIPTGSLQAYLRACVDVGHGREHQRAFTRTNTRTNESTSVRRNARRADNRPIQLSVAEASGEKQTSLYLQTFLLLKICKQLFLLILINHYQIIRAANQYRGKIKSPFRLSDPTSIGTPWAPLSGERGSEWRTAETIAHNILHRM